MFDGEITNKQVTGVIPSTLIASGGNNIPANPFPDCCSDYVLKVFADASGKPLQNDVNSVWWRFAAIITGATLKLKRWENNAWVVKATISDNTYGTYNAFGNPNNEGENWITLEIAWANVLDLIGEGSYKVTCTYTIPIGSPSSVDIDSYEFCLKTYDPLLVDGTVRLEYWLSGTIGDKNDDTKFVDFGSLNIYNSLRVKGFFGYPKASYKSTEIEYTTGQRVFVEDEQTPLYQCELWSLPFFIHEIVRTDFMMADTLAITDYNSKNNAFYIQKFVRKESGYEPKWYELQSNFASVELMFRQAYNRNRKLRN